MALEEMTTKDALALGWLDAIWGGFSIGSAPGVPRDITRHMIRKGWVRPTGPAMPDGISARPFAITPLGQEMVIHASKLHGIAREGIDDPESSGLPPEAFGE